MSVQSYRSMIALVAALVALSLGCDSDPATDPGAEGGTSTDRVDLTLDGLGDSVRIDLRSQFENLEDDSISFAIGLSPEASEILIVTLDTTNALLFIHPVFFGSADLTVVASDSRRVRGTVRYTVRVEGDLCPPASAEGDDSFFALDTEYQKRFAFSHEPFLSGANGETRITGEMTWKVADVSECVDRIRRDYTVRVTFSGLQEEFWYSDPDRGWFVTDTLASTSSAIFSLYRDSLRLGAFTERAIPWRFPAAAADTKHVSLRYHGGETFWWVTEVKLVLSRQNGLVAYERHRATNHQSLHETLSLLP